MMVCNIKVIDKIGRLRGVLFNLVYDEITN